MKVKILKSAAGARYTVYADEEREFPDKLARELIKAGIAAPVRQQKRKMVKRPPEHAAQ